MDGARGHQASSGQGAGTGWDWCWGACQPESCQPDAPGWIRAVSTALLPSALLCRHEPYDARSDCWSFGVLLVELLTQQKPYSQLYMTPVQIAIQVGVVPRCWSFISHVAA